MTLIAIDIETTCINPWEDNARIIGVGICWGCDFKTQTMYITDPAIMEQKLKSIADKQLPVIFYNNAFETMWFRHFYPDLKLNVIGDSFALAFFLQNNALLKDLKSVTRALFETEAYEEELKEYILSNFEEARVDTWKSFIHRAPVGMVSEYCRYDAFWTWMIWTERQHHNGKQVVNHTVLTPIYLAEVELQVEAILEGIPVDIERLNHNLKEVENKIEESRQNFLKDDSVALAVTQIIANRYVEYARDLKKPVTFQKWSERQQGVSGYKNCELNTNSAKQLADIFSMFGYGTKDRPWPALTKGGKTGENKKPSFAADDLWRYGEQGQKLHQAFSLKKAREKLESILSETHNGRLRSHVKVIGTDTMRVSGTNTNLPALQFGDDYVGSCLTAPEGNLVLSLDFVALEPTVMALITEDDNMLYVTCTGKGKLPYWRESEGQLIIDDLYIQTMSQCSDYTEMVRRLVIPEVWVKDPDSIKNQMKSERFAFKTFTLARLYGSGIPTLQNTLYSRTGKTYSEEEVQKMCFALQRAFPILNSKKVYYNSVARQTGRLKNPFGLTLHFDHTTAHAGFNHLIQSTGACIMKTFLYYLLIRKDRDFKVCIPNIHDASFFFVKEDQIDKAKQLCNDCLAQVNELLMKTYGFRYPLQISFSHGKTFYDVKG